MKRKKKVGGGGENRRREEDVPLLSYSPSSGRERGEGRIRRGKTEEQVEGGEVTEEERMGWLVHHNKYNSNTDMAAPSCRMDM